MSSYPSACATLPHEPPSPMTIDHGQVPGPEPGLMEMSEVEYTHLQHLFHPHLEPHAVALSDAPAARRHAATDKDEAPALPIVTTRAIDLATLTDEHYQVMPGEKTPGSPGVVPGSVLARVRGQDTLTEMRASQARTRSGARVCLEKRFNALSADTPRPQVVQSAGFSNFLTMLQQSAEAQETVVHVANPFEDCFPHGGGVFDQVTNICEQVISNNPYMVEPNKHPVRVVTKAHYTSGSNSTEEQQLVTIGNDAAVFRKHRSPRGPRPGRPASASPDSAGGCGGGTSKRARPHMSLIQRRERHNNMERERRKRIRLYCDELNMLVPFCDSDTDKVTTLQWTTVFLQYLQQTYGNAFKEEFQNACADGKEAFLNSSSSLGLDAIYQLTDEALGISHGVEQ
ncbi:transcription factor-like 5 protein [Pungitius pungitius]|uniref:transcription factor-like 5 protein n=1 Tax=Pungitius pungitius TaxID=134920 RepID=UPI002E151746